MKLSIVIPVHNGAEYLPELIDSLGKTDWSGLKPEVFLVEDKSTDNSLEILKQAPTSSADGQDDKLFTVIENEQNLGYVKTNNVGIRRALEKGADYVVLLNQDTAVEPDWIQELLRIMESRPDAGTVQPLLLYYKDKELVNVWGNYIHFLGFGYAGGNLEKLKDQSEKLKIREITYGSGAAIMLKAEAIRKIGLQDETLEMYHDDIDMGLRLRLAGYHTYFAPSSIVYHKYDFLSESRIGHYKYELMERNRLYIILSYYSVKTLILIFPAWLVMEIGVLLFASLRGFWKEKINGYAWIVKNWYVVMRKRRDMQSRRKINDKELTKDFVAQISFQEINNPLLTYIGNPLIQLYWWVVRRLI